MDKDEIKQMIREEIGKFFTPEKFVVYKNMHFEDGRNVDVGSKTGTQWGTATTQKQAFYGNTAVDQPATVTDPSISTVSGSDTVDVSVVTSNFSSLNNAVRALIDRLQELGLIA